MMWKSEAAVGSGQWAVGSKNQAARVARRLLGFGFVRNFLPTAHRPLHTFFVLLLTAHCTLLTVSCRRDMQDQPKMKPFRSSPFFRDGLSTRPPIEGTIARGFLKTDTEFYTGKKAGRVGTSSSPSEAPSPSGPAPGNAASGAAAYPDDVEVFPISVTKDTVTRGKERYEIFCSACHGSTGNGDGMIVRRGFRRAASFNDDRLRQAPVGHFFDAITNGWGVMPSYAPQIPTADRWAIIAYVRALQLSQQTEQNGPARAAGTPLPPSSAAAGTPKQTGGHQ